MSLRTVSGDGHRELVLVSEDVTARREEEAARHEAMDRLREVDAAKDAFVGGVSHELRTPLTTMTGFLELLEEGSFGPVTPEQRSALGRVAANNRRLLVLVDDLLTFARLGSDEAVVERREIDLRDVVRGACELVEPTWTARGVRTDVVLPDQPVLVLGDPTFLERVVLNLVGNAVKFTAEGGSVLVALTTVTATTRCSP